MTHSQAVELAIMKYPKSRRIAVENATAGQTDGMAFRMNLEADRQAYDWKTPTMLAINFVMKNAKTV